MKKLFLIVVLALFLIVSLGVVSAQDSDGKSIDVKIVWDDNGQDRPDYVTVNLIKDGSVVDTVNLNAANSWKTTFKVDDDGSYSVKEAGLSSDYSVKISGNAVNGYVITNKLVSADEDLLSAEEDTQQPEDGSNDNDASDDNETEVNGTDETTVNSNSTDKKTDSANNNTNTKKTNNTQDTNNTKNKNDTNGTPNKDVKKEKPVVKKEKPVVKKENKTTKAKLKHTGLPLVVLVLAAFAAIFVPLNRKK